MNDDILDCFMLLIPFDINEDKVELRYYSASKKTIYSKDITIPEDWTTLTLEF